MAESQAADLKPDRIPKQPLMALLPIQYRRCNPYKQLCNLLQHTHTAQHIQ